MIYLEMVLKLVFCFAAKCCVHTADVRAVVCTLMFYNMVVAFRRRFEALIKPFAIQARTLEHRVSVERFQRGACAGISSEILDCKPYLPQDAVQLQILIGHRILKLERGESIRRCHSL